jgi:hypothetical protein
MKTISITYAVVTEESAVHGDYAESGFLVERDPLVPEADETILDAVDQVVLSATGYGAGGGFESSCGESFYSIDGSTDYCTGEATTYAVHFDGLTDAELEAVAAYLTGK